MLYLELPVFRKLGFLRLLGFFRYVLHVFYGDRNAVPRHNNQTLLEVSLFLYLPYIPTYSSYMVQIPVITKRKAGKLYSYTAKSEVYRCRHGLRLHLCFATAHYCTACRSINWNRIHEILWLSCRSQQGIVKKQNFLIYSSCATFVVAQRINYL